VDGSVERRQDRLGFGIDDGHGGIRPGECTDAVDRFPQRHREEFDAAVDLALQQRGALISGDDFEVHDDFFREVTVIGRGLRMRCGRTPNTGNHINAPAASRISIKISTRRVLAEIARRPIVGIL
jgi:hypothetical protein